MARNLTILIAAELDIIEAYDWYEGREFGLGAVSSYAVLMPA
ncbi:MAG: hypothetical protein V7L00_11390 [Nostoc sp.]|nr:hypothetical protein [Nostoc sp. JL33]